MNLRAPQARSPADLLAPGKPLELYNLKKDIGETKDVAAANPKIVAKIEEILKTCRTEYTKGPKSTETKAKKKNKA